MKLFLRFAKVFIGFFFVLAGGYSVWIVNRLTTLSDKDTPTFISIALIAVGLTILWLDYRGTRS